MLWNPYVTQTVSLGYLCPDPGSDMLSVWSFWMRTWDVINVGCFLKLCEAEKNAVDLPWELSILLLLWQQSTRHHSCTPWKRRTTVEWAPTCGITGKNSQLKDKTCPVSEKIHCTVWTKASIESFTEQYHTWWRPIQYNLSWFGAVQYR